MCYGSPLSRAALDNRTGKRDLYQAPDCVAASDTTIGFHLLVRVGGEENDSYSQAHTSFIGFPAESRKPHRKATATKRITRMGGSPVAEIRTESSGGLRGYFWLRRFDIADPPAKKAFGEPDSKGRKRK